MNDQKEIVAWLKRKVKESGAKGLLFGLSGGVDSALVAVLAQKAVGKNHLAILMPCHSSKDSLTDARLMIKKFKLMNRLVDLSSVYDQMLKILPKGNSLALANLKPRLRMMTLYYFANSMNYLVCGTGNRSECMVGYFTKYGDGGVDILPIAGMLKNQVRHMAKELGIPERIIEKHPSADLWSGQTDEGEMGMTYSELDCVLGCMDTGMKSPVAKNKIEKVKKMIKLSEHKRRMPEIFIS